MLKTISIILVSMSFVGSAIFAGYQISNLNFSLKEEKVLNVQLDDQLQQAVEQNDSFKQQLNDKVEVINGLKLSLKEKDKRLSQLRNSELLRTALVRSREDVDRLNKQLEEINSERKGLNVTNIRMSGRLQKTTSELTRVVERLKLSEQKLADINQRQILPLQKQVQRIDANDQKKQEELDRLKQELSDLISNNRSLLEQIQSLEKEKLALEKDLSGIKKGIERQERPLKELQSELRQLKSTLADKERRVKSLETKLAKRSTDMAAQVKKSVKQQGTVGALKLANKNLNIQINQLNQELSRKKLELSSHDKITPRLKKEARSLEKKISVLKRELVSLGKAQARSPELAKLQPLQAELGRVDKQLQQKNKKIVLLEAESEKLKSQIKELEVFKGSSDVNKLYYKAQRQIKRFSELLVEKELELDDTKRQSLERKAEFKSLQAKLTQLERNFNKTKASQKQVVALEDNKISLQKRLDGISQELAIRNDLIVSLQKHIKSLEYESVQRGQEQELVTKRLYKADERRAKAEEKFMRQEGFLSDASSLYDALKVQVGHLSDMLAEKELELGQRRAEVYSLKKEITNLNSRTTILEIKLKKTKDNQQRSLEDLAEAIRSKAETQSRSNYYQSLEPVTSETSEQQRAEELRRRISVILEPEE